MKKISEKLGRNIKNVRVKKKMSQGDLCRKSGIDRGYMSAIENGKNNITIETLAKIASALDVSPDKLLK
jgi:transcriptional regulator with XRE-family HTH domain